MGKRPTGSWQVNQGIWSRLPMWEIATAADAAHDANDRNRSDRGQSREADADDGKHESSVPFNTPQNPPPPASDSSDE